MTIKLAKGVDLFKYPVAAPKASTINLRKKVSLIKK